MIQWSKALAKDIAHEEEIALTEKHWLVIETLREFYDAYHKLPTMRILIAHLKKSHTDFSSQELYALFPDHPLKRACKIAGLPKPPHCV
ncbi:MAG: TusE/DsrC/DsvC family sulfur relay protein [Gammaproteobacteria bacterium]